jgi:DNA-binding transcriptional MocR family regulator
MTLPKYLQVAGSIRNQIAGGTLAPGAPAPSAAALARATGYSTLTCRRALSTLVNEGTLVPGASASARPRVPGTQSAPAGQTLAAATRALSAALAARRRAFGLTQPELALKTGVSITTIGHAETGRAWQSRRFWEHADQVLDAGGKLISLHDAYRAAKTPRKQAEFEFGPGAATAAMPPAAEGPPAPASILIVWTDGATTVVPISRTDGTPGQP